MTRATVHISRIVVPSSIARDLHAVHRVLWRAFPDYPPQTPQPFLFREEPEAPVPQGEVGFLVQSKYAPQWALAEQLQVVSCRPVAVTFHAEDQFYFRLLASPVRRLMHPDAIAMRGYDEVKRTPPRLWTENWFSRRASDGGFEALELSFELSKVKVRKPKQKDFALSAAQFDGRLRVRDPAAFAAAWQEGIGTKKAYGFGLLSLLRG